MASFHSLRVIYGKTIHITISLVLTLFDSLFDFCFFSIIAYCDVTPQLSSYQSALKEQERYGQEEWKKKWANETIYNLILKEIPSIIDTYATPVDTNVFPNWQIFLENFLKQGKCLC